MTLSTSDAVSAVKLDPVVGGAGLLLVDLVTMVSWCEW